METSLLVKKLGKYLYKALPNTHEYKVGASECTILMSLYYALYDELPIEYREKGTMLSVMDKLLNPDMHEMILDINVTTYAGKIRVNIIELEPESYTVGHIVYTQNQLLDWSKLCNTVVSDILTKIEKRFSQYKFYKWSFR